MRPPLPGSSSPAGLRAGAVTGPPSLQFARLHRVMAPIMATATIGTVRARTRRLRLVRSAGSQQTSRNPLSRLRLSLYERRSTGGFRMDTKGPAASESRRLRRLAAAAGLAAAVAVAPASAHFVLESPAASLAQNAIGDPQKLGPCGGTAQDAGTPTGAVTELAGGGTLHLKLREAVYHPGHYRVALARTAAQLPADPETVTREGPRGQISASAAIEAEPAPPVLADGLFVHTAPPARGTFWEADLRVPNVDCKDCVVQVIQWMAEHPGVAEGGYSYHHCATVNITRNPDLETDGLWDAMLRG